MQRVPDFAPGMNYYEWSSVVQARIFSDGQTLADLLLPIRSTFEPRTRGQWSCVRLHRAPQACSLSDFCGSVMQ
jgi:hypothetical protein